MAKDKGMAKDKKEKQKQKGAKAAAKAAVPAGAGGAKPAKAEKKAKRVKVKPKGMRWVNPHLTVRDVVGALAWYERAFGFKTSFVIPGPDGKPVHAEMTHKKSVIMMGPESPTGRAPGKDSNPVSMYCYCDDVDAIAASAKAAGARVVEEPRDQFWGDRTCFLVDPEGHQWMFATHKFDMSPQGSCAGDDKACAQQTTASEPAAAAKPAAGARPAAEPSKSPVPAGAAK